MTGEDCPVCATYPERVRAALDAAPAADIRRRTATAERWSQPPPLHAGAVDVTAWSDRW